MTLTWIDAFIIARVDSIEEIALSSVGIETQEIWCAMIGNGNGENLEE